jgi:hypothetical protein
MPAFLERKLKAEYPNNPGAVWGTMNKIGVVRGNKITPKGEAMQRKHERDMGIHRGSGEPLHESLRGTRPISELMRKRRKK